MSFACGWFVWQTASSGGTRYTNSLCFISFHPYTYTPMSKLPHSSGVHRLFEGHGQKEGHFSMRLGSQESSLSCFNQPRVQFSVFCQPRGHFGILFWLPRGHFSIRFSIIRLRGGATFLFENDMWDYFSLTTFNSLILSLHLRMHTFNWLSSIKWDDLQCMQLVWVIWAAQQCCKNYKILAIKQATGCQNVIML